MRVTLLGTGAADGWPNPFCGCASCRWASDNGVLRGQTAALVDDELLLDCGPEVPRAAVRLGVSLTGVRHLLLTHDHPDHTGPAALLWRSWAGRREPLDLVGPPAALATCAGWIGPDDPVRIVEVRPGDTLTVGRYAVRALAADHPDGAVLYEIDGRLLYATDTGPLPAATLQAVRGAAYDLVLLEHTGVGEQHLNGSTFPDQLAELRRRGAVTPATRIVAIHLGHRNPPGPELHRRLGSWGAEALPDGALLEVGAPAAPRVAAPRRILVLGGARSGKSATAERWLAAEPAVTYVATGLVPGDADWAARVALHRARRPAGWRTVETSDPVPVLQDPPGPVLLDCLTLWLAAHPADADAADRLVAAWRDTPAYAIAVSNEVGSGVHPGTEVGRRFRDELGTLNARFAAASDEVWLVTAGIPQRLA